MKPSLSGVVHIQTNQQNRLTPAQKRFNGLIQKIDFQKKLLMQWQEFIPQYQQEVNEKLAPIHNTFIDCQIKMVSTLDTLFLNHKFTKQQQAKISDLICGVCGELIGQHNREDLKPIYARYSGLNYDDVVQGEREMANDFLKTMFEEEYDVDLGDEEFDFTDMEGTVKRLREKVQEQQSADKTSRPERKKTSKQLAREAREREEATNVSKSIQAVYRQLVAALHPDRESDPGEHERKTDLMKKVTVAYGNRDLLQLLQLQLSVEQIDQVEINNITDDHLKYYNKILQNQLEELREEVMQMELKIKATAGCPLYGSLTPKKLLTLLDKDIRTLKNEISGIQEDLQLFTDVKQFKSWLRGYQINSHPSGITSFFEGRKF
ncbi:MAG: molecular chaperone DnaJ [Nitrosomonas sp.]|nr:molecular chaperone DnaJ [Nitrosomonas sp.]